MPSPLPSARIVLGVTGSIACYKAADLASKLSQAGAQVDTILTGAATKFRLAPHLFVRDRAGRVHRRRPVGRPGACAPHQPGP